MMNYNYMTHTRGHLYCCCSEVLSMLYEKKTIMTMIMMVNNKTMNFVIYKEFESVVLEGGGGRKSV